MGATRNTGYLENLIQYDASDNVAIATSVNPSYKVTLGGSMLGTSALFSLSSGIGMTIRGDWDRSATNNSQLYIQGNTNTNKQLRIGYDTTGNVGYIQALTSGTSVDKLLINPSGGNVGIGASPDLALTVNGAINMRNSTRAGAFEIDASGNLWIGTATTAGNIYLETGHSTTGLPSTGTARLTLNQNGATFSSSLTATSAAFNTSIIIGNVSSLTGSWGNLTSVLQLGNSTTDKGYISVNEISGDDDINIVRYAYFDNTNWKRIGGGNPSRYFQRNAEHVFQYASSGADNTTITWNNALYITNGGSVGIGTTTINDKLDVYGNIRTSINTSYYAVSNYLGTNYYLGSSETTDNIDFKINGGGTFTSGGNFRWFTQAGGATPSERMRIAANGTVTVYENIRSYYGFVNYRGGTGRGGLYDYATVSGAGTDYSTSIFSETGQGIYFLVNGTTTKAMTITSGGNVLISTTDSAINSGVGIKLLNDSNRHISAVSADSTNANGETFVMYSTTAAAYRFYVGWGGTIYATSTTISGISDIRLKENIRDINYGLNEILLLKPRTFDWKEGKGKNIKNDRGFIAQEFEQIFPDLIDEWKDKSLDDNTPYKSVRADLIPVLVKAIQEQQAQIEELKSKLS